MNVNVAIFNNYRTGAQNSRLFKNFPKDLIHSLASENITSNFHSWSMSVQVALRLHFNTTTIKLVKWTDGYSTLETCFMPTEFHPQHQTQAFLQSPDHKYRRKEGVHFYDGRWEHLMESGNRTVVLMHTTYLLNIFSVEIQFAMKWHAHNQRPLKTFCYCQTLLINFRVKGYCDTEI